MRESVTDASKDGIGCVGSTQVLRGCVANPSCYSIVVGAGCSVCTCVFCGVCYMFRMCVAAKIMVGGGFGCIGTAAVYKDCIVMWVEGA